MLASRFRLGRSNELTQVLRRGRVARVKGFSIRTLATPHTSSRFAISISQKANKLATARNRVRRQITGVLMDRASMLQGGRDCAIAVYSEAFTLSSPERKNQFLILLNKARLLRT